MGGCCSKIHHTIIDFSVAGESSSVQGVYDSGDLDLNEPFCIVASTNDDKVDDDVNNSALNFEESADQSSEEVINHPAPEEEAQKAQLGVKLIDAISKGADLEQIQELIKLLGKDINRTKVWTWNPLTLASMCERADIIDALIKAGADVNIQSICGMTALMIAANRGHTEVARLLMASEAIKADVNIQSIYGSTALMCAAARGHAQIVELLMTSEAIKADVNIRDVDGGTALMLAVLSGRAEVVELLMTSEAININHQSNDGESALTLAARVCGLDIVQLLIDRGADVIGCFVLDEQGNTIVKPEYRAPLQIRQILEAAYHAIVPVL